MSEDLFHSYLEEGEKILWTGQPETSFRLNKVDYILSGFGLFWTLWVVFQGAWIVVRNMFGHGFQLPGLQWWDIPNLLFGSYMIFIRIIIRNNRKRITHYGVTNKRVMVLTQKDQPLFRAIEIDEEFEMEKHVRQEDGVGTITFGYPLLNAEYYENSGLPVKSKIYGEYPLGFFDIANAESVYDTIAGVRNTGKTKVYDG